MRSATHDCELQHLVRPTPIQSVKFKDGMVITADDLDTAMRYPLSVFQTLVRAYFGCGIVCGLDLQVPGKKRQPDEKCPPSEGSKYIVCIDPGVALGCDGYPIELCKRVTIDLTPDPCGDRPRYACIAIRRHTSEAGPRRECACNGNGCGCGGGGKSDASSGHQCARIKEHVEIKVFDGEKCWPRGICALPKPKDQKPGFDEAGKETEIRRQPPEAELCACLTECDGCDPCLDSWVLLGCVKIPTEEDEKRQKAVITPDLRRRKYVKPIHCHCHRGERPEAAHDRLEEETRGEQIL